MNTIGTRIRFLRQEHCLTQRELSEKAGISRAAIIDFEMDKRKIQSDNIIILSRFFGVTSDWLLCGAGEWYENSCGGADVEEKVKWILDRIGELRAEGDLEVLDRVMEFIEFEVRVEG